MMNEKVCGGKLDPHSFPYVFFKLKNPDAMQFPRRVLDDGCDQSSPDYGIEPEPRSQEDIE